VDRPEGGTLRQEPGGQEAQEPLGGARQKRVRDDDMTLYRHRHHMWSTNDTGLWCESVRSYGSSKNASGTASRLAVDQRQLPVGVWPTSERAALGERCCCRACRFWLNFSQFVGGQSGQNT
jgi:hypothetical protein